MRAALAYAAAGLPIFPCRCTIDKAKGSKAPHLPAASAPGKKDGGHWLASTDAERVGAWWRRWPDALIGFPTGRRTGTAVIDLDPRDTAVETMLQALIAWCGGIAAHDPETGEIIRPALARTQSGGLHVYYRYPADHEVDNRANLFGHFTRRGEAPAALEHIDVRGEGGYVIAPPSVMANGARYEWIFRPEKTDAGAWRLPPMPARLLAVITRELLPRAERVEAQRRKATAARFSGSEISDARVRRFVKGSIDKALRLSREAQPGKRNELLFEAAMWIGRFVRGGQISEGEAERLLVANLPAGVSPGEHKARQTIQNGLHWENVPAFSPDELRATA